MLKKLLMLFKIGRRLSASGAISSIYEIYNPPFFIKLLFYLVSLGLKPKFDKNHSNPGKNLCNALQDMGTTFIKLGQFLATRPDIIGENLSKELERLQDKLPPFKLEEAKKILKEELGDENFSQITNFSEPIAAASIAQVHLANIKQAGSDREVAIKILRPDIEKILGKIKNGIDFFQTQYVFEAKKLEEYMKVLEDAGILEKTSFLIGLGPFASAKSAKWMNDNLYGVDVPNEIIKSMHSRSS